MNAPKSSDFLQQRLKAWQPILTPKWVIISFAIVGCIFVPIGGILLSASNGVVEASIQYGGSGHATSCTNGGNCTVDITVTEKMSAPVYIYYELDNFYQNHRRYVKSRSDQQLSSGEIMDSSKLGDCDPKKTGIANNETASFVLHPCGLVASSFFNDSYTFSGYTPDETGIAWKSDVEKKFKKVSTAEYASAVAARSTGAADARWFLSDLFPGVIDSSKEVEDEHFIVWMRVAALPRFRKLWGKIDLDIAKDTVISVTVDDRFNVDAFEGKKSLVLSTTSFMGGKNPFLGWAYIFVGLLCILLAIAFAVKQCMSPRKPGDTEHLQWSPSH